MVDSVLLRGWLSKESLTKSFIEVENLTTLKRRKRVSLIIESCEGDAEAAVDFIRRCKEQNLEYLIKIYEAKSAAALIAISLGDYREMWSKAELALHRPEFRLSPTQISPDGKVDESVLKSFKRYDDLLVQSLKAVGLDRKHLTSKLYATDWLRLSSAECVAWGVVQVLF
jgi:hypothetical protein